MGDLVPFNKWPVLYDWAAEIVPIAGDNGDFSSGNWELANTALQLPTTQKYLWIVIAGGLIAFFMAWGIGANDVANAFATSVGAGSLSLLWACIIGGVMEFLGAVLLGKTVTDTVRKKIIKPDVFDPNMGLENAPLNGPEALMAGNLAALTAASIWLFVATSFGLPVSTTHSIIGALIGIGLTFGGGDAVVWMSNGSGLDRLKGVVGVVVSWFVSPLLSAIFAIILFLIVRTTVLRRENPVRAGFVFTPLLYGFAMTIVIFFILYKGAARLDDDTLSTGARIGIGFGAGAVVAAFTWFIINPMLRSYLERWEGDYVESLKNPTKGGNVAGALRKIGVHVEVTEELSDEVLAMHDNSEKFDLKTEKLFSWVQVFTAAFDAFSHGANDVANSIGPFATIYALYENQGLLTKPESDSGKCGTVNGLEPEEDYFYCPESATTFGYSSPIPEDLRGTGQRGTIEDGEEEVMCYTACNPGSANSYKSFKQDVPIWILVLGGAGIVIGLATWGYKIIVAIGTKLTKLTPSRGFCIELGASITVLIASQLGLPVSTTHCQVGATVGVGVVELKGNTVNWKQFLFIFGGWVFTLIFTGLISSAVFAFSLYTPQKQSLDIVDYCPGNQMFVIDQSTITDRGAQFVGIVCSGLSPRNSALPATV